MNTPSFWIACLIQALLRGTVWLLLVGLAAHLLRGASAARRALTWQAAFAGLILLPLFFVFLPALPLIRSEASNWANYSGTVQRYSAQTPILPKKSGQGGMISQETRVSTLPEAPAGLSPEQDRESLTSAELVPSQQSPAFRPSSSSPITDHAEEAVINAPAAAVRPSKPASEVWLQRAQWLFLWGWSAGATWSLLSLVSGLAALHRLGSQTTAVTTVLSTEMQEVTERLVPGRSVALRLAARDSRLHVPVTWGIFRPVVMLPSAYIDETPARARAALMHELSHVRRGDWAWLVLAQAACALYWCVPFAWIAARCLRREIELACDDSVLVSGVSPIDYAAQILDAARTLKLQGARLPISALTMARPPLAESRIRAILDPRRPRQPVSRRGIVLAALVPALFVPLLSLRAVAAAPVSRENPGFATLKPESVVPGASLFDGASMPAPALIVDDLTNTIRRPLQQNWGPGGKHAQSYRPGSSLVQFRRPGGPSPSKPWPSDRITFSSSRSLRSGAATPFSLRVALPDPNRSTARTTIDTRSASPRAPATMNGTMAASPSAIRSNGQISESMELRPIAWGPLVEGLQVGLRLVAPKAVFAPGELIWQEAYLRNRSTEEVVVSATGGYEEQGAPIITNAKGVRIKVLRYFGMGLMFTVSKSMRPGELGIVGRYAVAFQATDKGSDAPHEVAPGLSFSAEGTALALTGQGSYSLRQEIAVYGADGKTLRKTLVTGAIGLKIAGEPMPVRPVDRNHIADLATAPIAWGQERSGLTVGLMTLGNRSLYFIGERVRLAVVLRNVSKRSISFWHETSFAFLEPPMMAEAGGGKRTTILAPEREWRTLHETNMTGVTYDMTYAPSADGPSRIRQTEIKPGQSVIGYYLTAFVVPPKWSDGHSTPGTYSVVQPVKLGLGETEQLDTLLETGGLKIDVRDPDTASPSR